MNYRKKIIAKKGFTLIELILIIAILAIVIGISLSSYQQRETNLKLEKTAIQIQELLQAATAYWGDKNVWPVSGAPDFADYIPLGNTTNPWNDNYSYGVNPNDKTQFQVYSGSLPNKQLVNRLISLLPNAVQDPNYPNEVIAFVTPPKTPPQNYLVQQIGSTDVLCDYQMGPWQYCRQGKTFYLTCPNNWSPQLIMSTEWLHPDETHDRNALEGSNPISTLGPLAPNDGQNPGDFCVATGTPNHYQCNIRAMASTAEWNGFNHKPSNLGLVTYAYIAYCIPNSPQPELRQNANF